MSTDEQPGKGESQWFNKLFFLVKQVRLSIMFHALQMSIILTIIIKKSTEDNVSKNMVA
jgi:hypothetical protein